MRIEICVGSSCHLKGAYHLVKAFERLIAENKLEKNTNLQLVGSFCQGDCTRGVVVKIDDTVFTQVTPEKIPDFFTQVEIGGGPIASNYNP